LISAKPAMAIRVLSLVREATDRRFDSSYQLGSIHECITTFC
jgi:hypothetical protein